MAKSIKINFALNLANTIAGLLFPLVTFPYSSRIIMAEGIGQVNFFQSIINYIILFTSIGIPMYATREIARNRDDNEEMSKTAIEILILHAFLTLIGYLTVAILCVFVAEIAVDIPLFLLLSLSVFFTAIGCEWFYKGIEDFLYITVRGLTIRIIFVVLLFLLVHTKEDLMGYAFVTVGGTVGNNVFNFIRLRKHINLRKLHDLHPFKHLKPSLHVFVLNVVISIYVNLNSVMLGFMQTVVSVGLYAAATRIITMLRGVVTSFTTALLPRMSNVYASKDFDKFRHLSQMSIRAIFLISLPLSVGTYFCAEDMVLILAGSDFEDSIFCLKCMAPTTFVIALSGVLGIQILYPQGQTNKVILCTAIGAVVNIVANLLLIPTFAHIGVSISTLIAETAVTSSMLFLGRKYFPFTWKDKNLLKYIFATIMMSIVLFEIQGFTENCIIELFVYAIVGTCSYGFILLIVKEQLIMDLVTNIRNKIHK